MIEVDYQGNIQMTRGDDVSLQVDLFARDGTPYAMASNDKLTLTVRKNADAAVTFQASATGTNTISIPHATTSSLDAGKYVYDIELLTAGGDRDTVVGGNKISDLFFHIIPDITR